jgi:hypothetical protein
MDMKMGRGNSGAGRGIMLGTRGLEVIVVGSRLIFFVQVLGAKTGLQFVRYITTCIGLLY